MIVLVTGRPGSGKTTLARRIGEAMPCPVVSRDEIAQGVAQGLGHYDKDLVNRLAFDAFFHVLAAHVSHHVTIIAEAAFQHPRWSVGLRPLLPLTQVKIVHCVADATIAQQRVATRQRPMGAGSPRRSGVHTREAAVAPDPPRPFEPLSLMVPSLTVTTAEGYAPGLDEIIVFARRRPAPAGGRS